LIYQLTNYLKVQLNTYIFVSEGFLPKSSDNSIAIRQGPGQDSHFDIRTDFSVQIISRNVDIVVGKVAIDAVYNLLKNRFGLVLPTVTVDSVVYPELTTSQITPNQTPSKMGTDENNRWLWVFNSTIII